MEYMKKTRSVKALLTEDEKQKADIQALSYDYACRIVRLFQYLTEDSENKEFVISKQVYRSGTSVGANVREANHAQSDADFLNKMNIALKEADETDYWLNLLHDNGYISQSQFESLNTDGVRVLKCLTSIVKSMKSKLKK